MFFALHFLLILLVCLQDTFSVLSSTPTIFPSSFRPSWSRAADLVSVPLGQTLSETNFVRKAILGYLNASGTEGGYSYFAPNVPNNYKIAFELRYPDGHTEVELPQVSSRATGLRLFTLLDAIAEEEYEPLRAMMVKMLAYAVWQEHSDATNVRAVFGYVDLPTPAEFRRGQKSSSHFLFAYDFDFTAAQDRSR
jgi:hypothetical protein